MDGVLVVIAMLIAIIYAKQTNNALPLEIDEEAMETVNTEVAKKAGIDLDNRVSKLNDKFFEDPNAFMRIANALGFPKE